MLAPSKTGMASPRALKLVSAVVILMLVSGTLYHREWATRQAKKLRKGPVGFPSGTHDMVWKTETNKALDKVHSAYREDAHVLTDADDFLPHFRAVTEMPAKTLNETKLGCHWEDVSKVNFQYSTNEEWVLENRPEEELESRRKEWHSFVANNMVSWEKHKHNFSGRGVAILGGNEKSLNRVKVTLGQMHLLKSELPVEIHYWGDELNDTSKTSLMMIYRNLYFNDLSGAHNTLATNHDNTFYVNYQLKPAAVVNSRFEEVLFLDSDNIPVVDPALLFESETYKTYGSVFWPDIARTRPENPMWGITNTECRMDEYEMESGQILVDKRKYFYHLQLAAWFNNVHGEYYNNFLLGDKDLFRFAWHALKTTYGRPSRWITSVGTLVPSDPHNKDSEPFFCGHSFGQHHPDRGGPIAFFHGGLMKQIADEVIKWHVASQGGIFQAYKRAPDDEDKLATTQVFIKWDPGEYLPDEWRPDPPAELKINYCTDFKDVQVRNLEELVPGFNPVFKKLGGYWHAGVY
ncbi:hypothetical protein ANO11243_042990 [Dothideomycetidae sp. 11243]|nr:hypothetical protein ANO11243_042990 [fungal sp. No.11243]